MDLLSYIDRMRKIDQMIRSGATGTPGELAQQMGISERTLYEDIGRLRDELGCPIAYSREKKSYYYLEDGKIDFGFK